MVMFKTRYLESPEDYSILESLNQIGHQCRQVHESVTPEQQKQADAASVSTNPQPMGNTLLARLSALC
jgi:hypothetical protein